MSMQPTLFMLRLSSVGGFNVPSSFTIQLPSRSELIARFRTGAPLLVGSALHDGTPAVHADNDPLRTSLGLRSGQARRRLSAIAFWSAATLQPGCFSEGLLRRCTQTIFRQITSYQGCPPLFNPPDPGPSLKRDGIEALGYTNPTE